MTGWLWSVFWASGLCCLPQAQADSRPYYLRNYSPFLSNFGLPAPEGGRVTARGDFTTRFDFTLVNHADSGESARETILLDGESYFADLSFRYGIGERWELGLDLPYVSHQSGQFDNFIENWHDLVGTPNTDRRGPSNTLQLTYHRDGATVADLREGSEGIGDIRLSGGYQILSADQGGRALALRGHVKLPTGNEEALRGTGATGFALSLDATDRRTLAGLSAELFAQAGVLVPGDSDLFGQWQQEAVPFGSLGFAWPWTRSVDLRLQLAVQGEYFDSGLEELGSTASVAFGGVFNLRRSGLQLDVALVEDLVSDATPDFGIHFSLRTIADVDR